MGKGIPFTADASSRVFTSKLIESDCEEVPEPAITRNSGERRLCAAILLSGISESERPGKLGRQARWWVLNRRRDYLTSFETLCTELGFDPQAMRWKVVAGWPSRIWQRKRSRRSPKDVHIGTRP